MSEFAFDLDLRNAEEHLEVEDGEEFTGTVVLGELDGSTAGQEWLNEMRAGNVLILAIEGDLATLAADFAPDVKQHGGTLMHFRDFLVVTPNGVDIDNDRLQ
ncbi:DUF5779 family protein [Halobacteriaceae archaeon GCM10025711]